MKRLILFLLALVFTFTACGTLHTAQWEPRPTPPAVTQIPRTPEEQLLYDLSSTTQEAANHTLCGTAEYNGRKFAMIATEGVGNYLQLAEYEETDEGYVLLARSDGWAFSTPGYIPIVAQFEDLTVCWSYITSQRLVPDNDGNAENDVYIPNDYTAIRMTLADGTVRDEPITCDLQTSNLFFCVLDSDNLPTGFVPLAGDTEITAWATGTGEVIEPIPAIVFHTSIDSLSHEEKLIRAAKEKLHFAKEYSIDIKIVWEETFGNRNFVLLDVQNDTFGSYLAEYTDNHGTYEIIAWSYDTMAPIDQIIGYSVNYTKINGTNLCWIRIRPDRIATTEDGTKMLDVRQTNDYTAIRFSFADGSTQDAFLPLGLATDYFALQVFPNEWPVSAVPLVEKTVISACKIDFSNAYTAQTQ